MPEIYISAPTNMPSLPQMCAICRDDIEEVAPGVVRPIINRELTETCNHVFHDYCIEAQRAHNVNCPNCRSPIYDADDLTRPRVDLVHNYRESVNYFYFMRVEQIRVDGKVYEEGIRVEDLTYEQRHSYVTDEYYRLRFFCRDHMPDLKNLALNFQDETCSLSRKKRLFALIRAHVEFARIDFDYCLVITHLCAHPRPNIKSSFFYNDCKDLEIKIRSLRELTILFQSNPEDTLELQTQVIKLLLNQPLRDLISNDDIQDTSIRILPQCFEIPIVGASGVFPSNYWDGRVSRLFRSPENRMSGGFLDPLLRYAGVSFGRNNATSDRSEESNETQRSYGFFSYVYSLWESLLSKIIAIFGFGEI